MNIQDSIDVQRSSYIINHPAYDANGQVHNNPQINSTDHGGLTKLEYFMLEITKAVTISGRYGQGPKLIVNTAQLIFEELKKRIEDIEDKGLLSDQQKEYEKVQTQSDRLYSSEDNLPF